MYRKMKEFNRYLCSMITNLTSQSQLQWLVLFTHLPEMSYSSQRLRRLVSTNHKRSFSCRWTAVKVCPIPKTRWIPTRVPIIILTKIWSETASELLLEFKIDVHSSPSHLNATGCLRCFLSQLHIVIWNYYGCSSPFWRHPVWVPKGWQEPSPFSAL